MMCAAGAHHRTRVLTGQFVVAVRDEEIALFRLQGLPPIAELVTVVTEYPRLAWREWNPTDSGIVRHPKRSPAEPWPFTEASDQTNRQ